jgi:hypothetical protein
MHSTAGQLALAGVLAYVAVMAIGLPTCVRINKMVGRWSIAMLPADLARYRARWIRFHILRTLFSVPAFAFYILSCLLAR